jgi:drug/metabolite transporter superfamily protein YnfA
MDIARSIALFGVAVVAEIGGACLVWHRMKRELLAADVTWAIPGHNPLSG